MAGADRLIAQRVPALFTAPGEKYGQRPAVTSPQGLTYVTYDRQYRGLPVVGGDFTVVTDAHGVVRSTSVAQTEAITVDTAAAVTAAQATAAAKAQLTQVGEVVGQRLVVLAWGTPKLAWETVVTGRKGQAESRLHVFVDALSGQVIRSYDDVQSEAGQGTAHYNGPSPLTIDTTLSGGTYSMKDPKRPGLSCADYANGTIFSGPDNKWGNGSASDRETGCVDALFSAQREWDMLKEWYGRDGIDGQGNGFRIQVGLQENNAYWTGDSVNPYVKIGYNSAKEWLSALDVVGHEFGHGLDQYTGSSSSVSGEAGLGEATGDIFGALTEAYANESTDYDSPDYTVGEEINFSGNGPIRNMYDPSKVSNDPNCYSSSIPNTEVHKAAGPLNHWFYLLAVGSNRSGNPTSPTCNNTAVTGLGDIRKAGAIFYNAMLAKTSNMTYKKYRTLTLQSAKNIDSTCAQFTAVKAAWDAISVGAQSGDPTCTGTSPTPSPTASPTVSPTVGPTTSPTASPTSQPGGTVTVTNPGQQSGFKGFQAFPVQVRATASNGAALTFSATGLPPGLVISAAGSISGTPTTAGTYSVTVTAATSGGAAGSATFSYQIYGF